MELVVLFYIISLACAAFLLYINTSKGKKWFKS